jgi:formyl-CoA transferase/CoA:oxalate CoA-transferase
MGVIGALYELERSGEGQAIDVALFDSQATWLSNLASAFLATGAPPHKRGNVHPNIAPYQPFHASDGSFILAAGTELLWERVLTVTDTHATIGTDLRFATNRDRVANREALEWALERVFARRSANEWIHAFESAGVPCGPILSPDQTLTHPHLRARDMIVELQHETAGPVRSLGNPIRLSRTPVEYRNAAPTLGRDTETILNELGFRADQIDRLRADGVV